MKRCKFSKRYLETYRSGSQRKIASKKRGSGKPSEYKKHLVIVLWDNCTQSQTIHKDSIDFIKK